VDLGVPLFAGRDSNAPVLVQAFLIHNLHFIRNDLAVDARTAATN
jgi:hypothetical protein